MNRSIALAAFALAGTLASAVSAQTLPTLGDTFFAQGNASNFGTSPTINVGGVGAYRGLIQFDLSSLPSPITGASIAKASLALFVNKVGSAGAININAANGAWSEKQRRPGDRCENEGELSYSTVVSYLSVIKRVREKWEPPASLG